MNEDYNKAIEDAIKTIKNYYGASCLCGHFDSCDGSCKPTKDDYIELLENLKKSKNE